MVGLGLRQALLFIGVTMEALTGDSHVSEF